MITVPFHRSVEEISEEKSSTILVYFFFWNGGREGGQMLDAVFRRDDRENLFARIK